ncbi:MAG: hypothetical protein Q7U74_06080, partial [Saprospiraceae bacterium]|nr:hypothetical protein [Saprospiraceae bacterium]
MSTESDFSHLSRFPGETGNTFDVILHAYQVVERIPVIVFAVILLALAAIPTWLNWMAALALFGFFLLDWLIIALLPRMGKSFGPSRPPVLTLAILRMFFGFLPMPFGWLFQIAGTILVIVSFWIEPHQLKVTNQTLETNKLPDKVHLRILHLGDLHIERITKREKELQHQIDLLCPDLILFSGDILNLSYRNDPTAMEQARQVIRQWKAPLGVFLVSGSPAVDLAENLPRLLNSLPVRWLQKEKVCIPLEVGVVDIVGITCTHRPFIDGPQLMELVPHPPENFTILLYHTPDLAPVAARAEIDL